MAKNKDTGSYLAKILVGASIIFLIGMWCHLKGGFFVKATWTALTEALIPELLGPLLAFAVLYLVFFRKGIDLDELLNKGRTRWLEKGYETYTDIDWTKYLTTSRKLVVVAFYLEKWITQNSVSLDEFISKKNSRLIVYLPDYRDVELMKKLKIIIPKYTEAELAVKIKESINEIKKKADKKATHDISVFLYKHTFNYTLQAFDNKMFISINELCREANYKSPFIQIDLNYSQNLQSFYEQEIITLENSSEKIALKTWTK